MNDHILVVEDSSEIRMALQIALEGQGYRVSLAADGREGIRVFRELKPDLVLLDVRMPKLSGIDVCTLIRNESMTPVIMFSGVDERADVLLAIQRGANDYVLKDTGFRELIGRVSKHLRRHTAAILTTQSVKRRSGRVLPFDARAVGGGLKAGKQGRAAVAQGPVAGTRRQKPKADLTGLKVQTVHIEPEAEAPGVEGEPLEDLIVVAHSEADSLDEMARIAARTDFEVVKASTGQQALAVLATRNPKLVVFSNVLSDMSCFTLVEAVIEKPTGQVTGMVLAMSRRSPELMRRARYLGVHAMVFQPWNDGRLDVAIRSALAATRKARSKLVAA